MTLNQLSNIGTARLVGWIEGQLSVHPEKPLVHVVSEFLAFVEAEITAANPNGLESLKEISRISPPDHPSHGLN